MLRFGLKTVFAVSLILGLSFPVSGETWKVDCNTCTGDKNGVYGCTQLFCGNMEYDGIKVGEPKIDWGYERFGEGIPWIQLDDIEIGLREDGVVVWRKR